MEAWSEELGQKSVLDYVMGELECPKHFGVILLVVGSHGFLPIEVEYAKWK